MKEVKFAKLLLSLSHLVPKARIMCGKAEKSYKKMGSLRGWWNWLRKVQSNFFLCHWKGILQAKRNFIEIKFLLISLKASIMTLKLLKLNLEILLTWLLRKLLTWKYFPQFYTSINVPQFTNKLYLNKLNIKMHKLDWRNYITSYHEYQGKILLMNISTSNGGP